MAVWKQQAKCSGTIEGREGGVLLLYQLVRGVRGRCSPTGTWDDHILEHFNVYFILIPPLQAAEVESAIMGHMGDNDLDKYVRTVFARVLRKRSEEAAMDAIPHRTTASTTDDIATHVTALSELSLRYNPR
jgi:hypothetical protein